MLPGKTPMTSTATAPNTPGSFWRELLLASLLSVAAALVAGYFDFHEAMYTLTRPWERLQLDELPLAMTVFACCLLFLHARRHRLAHRALLARRSAESALALALEENRELARQHLAVQEAERKHLARELHDEFGQYLNAIKIDAVTLSRSDLQPAQLTAAGERIVACADHVHAAVSDMIRRLRPVGLDELGLGAALEHCIGQWRQRLPGLQLTLSRHGNLEDLGEDRGLAVYRVVQEALTNASRHARPSRIDVRIERHQDTVTRDDRLEIAVIDDGVGMNTTRPPEGFGLRGMRERVELLGGTLQLQGAPGSGLAVLARLPLKGAV
jgi:signal transduction histidine kinase